MIPDTFWIHYGDRSLSTHAEAVRLTPEYLPSGFDVELIESIFKIVPCRDAVTLTAAFVLGLVCT